MSTKVFPSVSGAFACATAKSSSSLAESQCSSPVTLPFLTTRYGVSMKPRSLMRAYVESDVIRPTHAAPDGLDGRRIRQRAKRPGGSTKRTRCVRAARTRQAKPVGTF